MKNRYDIHIRLSSSVGRALVERAEGEGRSVSSMAIRIIELAVGVERKEERELRSGGIREYVATGGKDDPWAVLRGAKR